MTERRRASDRRPIRPVILSGGSGTRLWPLSRALHPKQLLPLASERSMLQETVLRVTGSPRFAPPLIVCNDEHRFIVAEQLRQLGIDAASILLEPEGRNTAPAAALAALLIAEADPEAVMLIMPSDHVIGEPERFRAAVHRAEGLDEPLVAFGIRPDRPETGYGYIELGEPLAGVEDCFRIRRFIEKPDRARAETFVASGAFRWNSGLFLFSPAAYLAELDARAPEVLRACRAALAGATRDLGFCRLDREAFCRSPSVSIDIAVMERAERAAVVDADMAWSDVGSWDALWEISAKQADGNVMQGDVFAVGSRNSYIRSTGPVTAVVGLDDAVVIATKDAVLVASRGRTQGVREAVAMLAQAGRREHLANREWFRPWGSFETLDAGDRFQVKRIVVKPGETLSLQMHHHRAEHWVVVRGTARVTRGEEVFLLFENESTYIPIGVRHRLENPGRVPLQLIEVQSGAYLGEDDIVRFDDNYGRS